MIKLTEPNPKLVIGYILSLPFSDLNLTGGLYGGILMLEFSPISAAMATGNLVAVKIEEDITTNITGYYHSLRDEILELDGKN